jgi:hypothetical protein
MSVIRGRTGETENLAGSELGTFPQFLGLPIPGAFVVSVSLLPLIPDP